MKMELNRNKVKANILTVAGYRLQVWLAADRADCVRRIGVVITQVVCTFRPTTVSF